MPGHTGERHPTYSPWKSCPHLQQHDSRGYVPSHRRSRQLGPRNLYCQEPPLWSGESCFRRPRSWPWGLPNAEVETVLETPRATQHLDSSAPARVAYNVPSQTEMATPEERSAALLSFCAVTYHLVCDQSVPNCEGWQGCGRGRRCGLLAPCADHTGWLGQADNAVLAGGKLKEWITQGPWALKVLSFFGGEGVLLTWTTCLATSAEHVALW